MLLPRLCDGVREPHSKKRKRDPEPERSSPHPTTKHSTREHEPPADRRSRFWNNLSVLHLTSRALRELDRRVCLAARELQPGPHDHQTGNKREIKRFARLGGPDLSTLRAYPHPLQHPAVADAMSAPTAPKRKADSQDLSDAPNSSKKSSRKVSAYDLVFEQHLNDHNIYITDDTEPKNFNALQNMLKAQRRSLSPSQFSDKSFKEFKANIKTANSENHVLGTVFPVIIGSLPNVTSTFNREFDNLAPLTDDTIVTCKPDYCEGSAQKDLNIQSRQLLSKYVVVSTDASLPCIPNFFMEFKGPSGLNPVATRQACYDGVMGARAIHKIRTQLEPKTAVDGNAYTISAKLLVQYEECLLGIYAIHPIQSDQTGQDVGFRMSKLGSWDLASKASQYTEGVAALRNAREWAKEQREELIHRANSKEAGVR